MKNKLTIRNLVERCISECEKPFFELAPEIVGSVTNPTRYREKGIVAIGLNLKDGRFMKLVVPEKCYDDNNKERKGARSFVLDFLSGSHPVESFEGVEDLNEIVDEYGNLFNDNEDLPANISSAPGYLNRKSGDQSQRQFVSRYQRLISPLGYGGVVW